MMPALDEHKTSERACRTEAINQKPRELGFDKVGVVAAEILAEEAEYFSEWLRRGYHGEMTYMARDPQGRIDPRRIFPAAKSVVAVALNYYTPHQHNVRNPSDNDGVRDSIGTGAYSPDEFITRATGKVSRYASGDEYHHALGEK